MKTTLVTRNGVGVIPAIIQAIPLAFMVELSYASYKNQKNHQREILQHYTKVHNSQNINRLDTRLVEYRKEFNNVLFGKGHQVTSESMSFLISVFDNVSDTTYLAKFKKAKHWFENDFKTIQEMKNSFHDRQNDHSYQINSCRLHARNNFGTIVGLLQHYHMTYNDLKKLNPTIPELSLLSVGQANEVLERYIRFVKNVKPFDDAMGYLESDGEIYKTESFETAVHDNLPPDLLKKEKASKEGGGKQKLIFLPHDELKISSKDFG
jgi:hypothetical protein